MRAVRYTSVYARALQYWPRLLGRAHPNSMTSHFLDLHPSQKVQRQEIQFRVCDEQLVTYSTCASTYKSVHDRPKPVKL